MRKTEKKIKVLNDMELRTPFGVHFLSKGEVKKICFKNIRSFQALLELGSIVEAAPDEEETKSIPVVYPEAETEDGEVK
jgi:hypothetical protein